MAKKKVTFAGAMGKVNSKVWSKAREVEPGGGMRTLPKIDDGVYPCFVTACKADTDKDGNPYMAFSLAVSEGEFKGVKLDKFHSIKDHEKDLERLVKTIKGIGYSIDEGMSPDEFLEGVSADINDKGSPQPEVMVAVKNGSYVPSQGPRAGEEVATVDVFVNRPRSEEDGASSSPAAPAKGAKATKATKAAPKKAAPKKTR